MAAVAGCRVICVSIHILVLIIRFTLPVFMAVETGEDRGTSGIMTGYAGNIVIPLQRERVDKTRGRPCRNGMALLAILGKIQ